MASSSRSWNVLLLLDGLVVLAGVGLANATLIAAAADLRLVQSHLMVFAFFGWIAEVATSFQIDLAIGLAVVVLWFVIRRRWWVVLAFVPFAAFTVGLLVPYWWPARAQAAPAASLNVVGLNLFNRNPTPERARDWLLETGADLLFLTEVRVRVAAVYEPVMAAYPHRLRSRDNDSALLSRHPLTPIAFDDPRIILARVCPAEGRCLRVIGVHTMAPFGIDAVRERDETLAAIAGLVRGTGEPVVVMGDLNTTPWTPAFRGLIAAGLADSAWGRGITPTWNADRRWLRVPIDHILTGNGAVALSRARGPYVGSDHFPITATIGF